MSVMAAWARDGAPEGAVVVADFQSAGRGRMGRRWDAPPGTALTLSVLFRPDPSRIPAARAGDVPMAVALAAIEAIERRLPSGCPAALKWPNDLVAGGRKVGGLLAEARWPASGWPEDGGVDGAAAGAAGGAATGAMADMASAAAAGSGDGGVSIIVGVGLNVHQAAHELPPGAASLATLGGVITGEGTRAALVADLLSTADRYYAVLLGGGRLVDAWAARLETLGREVVARQGTARLRGLAVGVADDGALLVRSPGGETIVWRAGDVTLAGGDVALAGDEVTLIAGDIALAGDDAARSAPPQP